MRAFPIRNDADHKRALALIAQIWDAEPGSEDADLLEVMSTLVDAYETAQSALPPGDPIHLIEFKLRELGWSQRELGRQLGWGNGRVSEILNRKRPLTLEMVRQLSRALEIPPGLLVHDVAAPNGDGEWVRIPVDLAKSIRRIAVQSGRDAQDIIVDALGRFLRYGTEQHQGTLTYSETRSGMWSAVATGILVGATAAVGFAIGGWVETHTAADKSTTTDDKRAHSDASIVVRRHAA